MKLEDRASADLAASGALGDVRFFRYSLTVNRQLQDHQTALLSEVLDWLKESGVTDLHSVAASYGKGKYVLLVTMAFANQVLANVFINMESPHQGFVKKTEIAGTKSLYVFDSESETAFTSDCIEPPAYHVNDTNSDNQAYLALIQSSLASGEMEVIK